MDNGIMKNKREKVLRNQLLAMKGKIKSVVKQTGIG